MQDICVRTLLAGSRVKARIVCQSQASWKAYVESLDAMAKEWADTGRALRSPEMTNGANPGRAYAPGGNGRGPGG